ncbi:ankyrin [Aspergillus heteromorphus CBS 117.55]|uniref:Ankyrin n=1 Tax=Aspergillus heteromorphus CBS 117.55 TaxID=1448321 RepID=A0A317VGH0_9EURO|nr:ankyrin [Aspergillus heteromorphus CBS 117.55]PWY73015.1 ankyrin [Aspergillus heteromorphus CBS 117.55]
MAYEKFRQIDRELEDRPPKPAIYDTEGAPLYEGPYQELFGAIVARNDVEALHRYNESPNTRVFWRAYEVHYWNPFVIAGNKGSFDALRALVEIYLADSTLTEPLDKYLERLEYSLMNAACVHANSEMVTWLLERDPPLGTLHDRDVYGETPLFCAAGALGRGRREDASYERKEEFFYWLLDRGTSVRDSDVYHGYQEEPDQPPKLKDTVLSAAISSASYNMVSRIIAEGADVHARQTWFNQFGSIEDAEQVTVTHIASMFWNLEGLKALADHCGAGFADMLSASDSGGRIPLHWALVGFRYLPCNEPLEEVASTMPSTVKMLLETNPSTINMRDQDGCTVFHYAVKTEAGCSSILPTLKLLFDARPDPTIINARNSEDATALEDSIVEHASCDGHMMEILDILLTNGANGRLRDKKGQNILHKLAIYSRGYEPIDPATVDRLVGVVGVNDADEDGCTVLHYMVRSLGHIDAVRRLISHGTDVNAVNGQGDTPLHEVMRGTLIKKANHDTIPKEVRAEILDKARGDMISLLRDAGASMEIRNAAGKTPPQLREAIVEAAERARQEDARRRASRARGGRGRGRG